MCAFFIFILFLFDGRTDGQRSEFLSAGNGREFKDGSESVVLMGDFEAVIFPFYFKYSGGILVFYRFKQR